MTLPPSFNDIQVEIIVLPVENRKADLTDSTLSHNISKRPVKHSVFGRLKVYANPPLIPKEKGAWEKAAAEKHALH